MQIRGKQGVTREEERVVRRERGGSSPTQPYPQKLSRRFSFASFGWNVKASVLAKIKISLSAIGDFLAKWVIPCKTIIKKEPLFP